MRFKKNSIALQIYIYLQPILSVPEFRGSKVEETPTKLRKLRLLHTPLGNETDTSHKRKKKGQTAIEN